MPQGLAFKGKKIQKKGKSAAPNRHGKTPKTRKGKMTKPPKNPIRKKQWEAEQELTKYINGRAESIAAGHAKTAGERIKFTDVPPVLASSGQKNLKSKLQKETDKSGEMTVD